MQVGKINKISQIACGSNYTVVVTGKRSGVVRINIYRDNLANGEVYSWGYGAQGRLGLGHEETREEPTRIDALVGKQVQGIAAGSSHTAITVIHGVCGKSKAAF